MSTGVALLTMAVSAMMSVSARAESSGAGSFVPSDDAQVVATVRSGTTTAARRELRGLRDSLAREPSNQARALALAGRLILEAREQGDPRLLGQAETVLAPWWATEAPSVEVLVLRATIRQSLHDFPGAIADLDTALGRDPHNAQAWLTKASVLTVRGEYEKARRACVPLLRLADTLVATTAAATIGSLTGRAARSVEAVEQALAAHPEAPRTTRKWALTQLAETCERLGRLGEAERHYRAAALLDPIDPYILGAYADFLLAQRRPEEAAALLLPRRGVDGLLLRLAEAHAAQPGRQAETGRDIAELEARFAAARERGDRLHLREEARFLLHLKRSPAEALALARQNWAVQKEPADAVLLWEAARAAGDADAENQAIHWVSATGLEDVRLPAAARAAGPASP